MGKKLHPDDEPQTEAVADGKSSAIPAVNVAAKGWKDTLPFSKMAPMPEKKPKKK